MAQRTACLIAGRSLVRIIHVGLLPTMRNRTPIRMKKDICTRAMLALAVLGLLGSAQATPRLKALPKLGSRCNPPRNRERTVVVVSPSQTYDSYKLTAGDTQFTVGYDSKKRIRWISTVDASFSTPDKIRVGDSLAKVLAVAPGGIRAEVGWAWFVPLPSGWNAMISKPGTRVDVVPNTDYRGATARCGF